MARVLQLISIVAVITGVSANAQVEIELRQYREYSKYLGVYDPGGYAIETTDDILGTLEYYEHDMQRIFRDARVGMDSYVFKIPNGTYRVTLNFAEIEKTASGERVFGISFQNQPIVEELDIFAEVGSHRAYQIVSEYVEVSDGILQLSFHAIVGEPLLSGISIGGETDEEMPGGYFQHVDVGGRDWFPDYGFDAE